MNSLITKSAVLVSLLTLLPLSSASADRKKAPLILIDGGAFTFITLTSATLAGRGLSTQMGRIASSGTFNNVGPNPECENGFLGTIKGSATAANGDTLNYEVVEAQFCPDPDLEPGPTGEPVVFNGVGRYKIVRGGTGKFARASGSGDFIGIADFGEGTYKCVLQGTISYPRPGESSAGDPGE
jgi:hypothetical protein